MCVCVGGGGGGSEVSNTLKHTQQMNAVLIVTVSHRTFSGQFRHLSGQFFPLSDKINTSSYVHRECF